MKPILPFMVLLICGAAAYAQKQPFTSARPTEATEKSTSVRQETPSVQPTRNDPPPPPPPTGHLDREEIQTPRETPPPTYPTDNGDRFEVSTPKQTPPPPPSHPTDEPERFEPVIPLGDDVVRPPVDRCPPNQVFVNESYHGYCYYWESYSPIYYVESSADAELSPNLFFYNELEEGWMKFVMPMKRSELTDIIWRFGDGEYSRELNPEHFYQCNGAYEVSFSYRSPYGSGHIVDTVYINTAAENCAPPQPVVPRASFTMETSGKNGRTLTLRDLTEGTDLYEWRINGKVVATQPQFTTRLKPGTYEITLVAGNIGWNTSDSLTQRLTIE